MRNILLGILLLVVLFGTASATIKDPQAEFEGSQMVPVGAPWLSDDSYMYFGNDKDVSARFSVSNNMGILGGTWATTGILYTSGGLNVPTGTSAVVTTADKLTVGGVIVPQYYDIPVQVNLTADAHIFLPQSNWELVSVTEIHAAPATYASTAVIKKTTSTTAPGSGYEMAASLALNSAANTPATATLSTQYHATLLNASTDRLVIDYSGAAAGYAGGVINIRLKRVA